MLNEQQFYLFGQIQTSQKRQRLSGKEFCISGIDGMLLMHCHGSCPRFDHQQQLDEMFSSNKNTEKTKKLKISKLFMNRFTILILPYLNWFEITLFKLL